MLPNNIDPPRYRIGIPSKCMDIKVYDEIPALKAELEAFRREIVSLKEELKS
jgi:hypothetical protein